MEYVIGFMIVGFICAMIAKKNYSRFGFKEISIITIVSTLIGAFIYGGGYLSQVGATEILNGEILNKHREAVSCSHSFSCNCRNVTSNGKTTTECDTCYEHTFDYDWILQSNVGKIKIDRVNRQGNIEPPRFSKAQIGDPVANTHFYINYVRGAKNSLFNPETETTAFNKYGGVFPQYPSNIYDYHYLDRVIFTDNLNKPSNIKDWNNQLSLMLRELGPKKEANIIYVITGSKDMDYIYGLNHAWKGMNKNDIVIIIGAENNKINWTSVISWSKDELFNVSLKDSVFDVGTIDNYQQILSVTKAKVNELFKRKQMSEYSYLDAQVEIPLWVIILAFIVCVAASFFVAKTLNERRYF